MVKDPAIHLSKRTVWRGAVMAGMICTIILIEILIFCSFDIWAYFRIAFMHFKDEGAPDIRSVKQIALLLPKE